MKKATLTFVKKGTPEKAGAVKGTLTFKKKAPHKFKARKMA